MLRTFLAFLTVVVVGSLTGCQTTANLPSGEPQQDGGREVDKASPETHKAAHICGDPNDETTTDQILRLLIGGPVVLVTDVATVLFMPITYLADKAIEQKQGTSRGPKQQTTATSDQAASPALLPFESLPVASPSTEERPN
jgi:hypothetical protein